MNYATFRKSLFVRRVHGLFVKGRKTRDSEARREVWPRRKRKKEMKKIRNRAVTATRISFQGAHENTKGKKITNEKKKQKRAKYRKTDLLSVTTLERATLRNV